MKNIFNKLQGFVSNDKALSDKHLLELRKDWFASLEQALNAYKQAKHNIPFTGARLEITLPKFAKAQVTAKGENEETSKNMASKIEEHPLLQKFIAAYEQFPPFQDAARQHLIEARFNLPPHFQISAVIIPEPDEILQNKLPEGEYVNVVLLTHKPEPTKAWLVVEGGRANEPHFLLDGKSMLFVGRMAVVTDKRGTIIRQNTLAFYAPDEIANDPFHANINKSISRRHAKVNYDDSKNRFIWVNEDGITRLMRQGFKEPLILRNGQSVPLEDDDCLYLGKSTAALRFKYAQ